MTKTNRFTAKEATLPTRPPVAITMSLSDAWTLVDGLQGSFKWAGSKAGHEFWSDIVSYLRTGLPVRPKLRILSEGTHDRQKELEEKNGFALEVETVNPMITFTLPHATAVKFKAGLDIEMDWCETDQGFEFWCDLHGALYDLLGSTP